ncbi:hypothetical protein predicted by Glimmer/Critica [Acetobacter ghanensis]|uniref:Uncharacterized protein n=1 Tax=Acetobacter ghanensis TaxID=431306 RepID=A0A0U5BGF1_9PROT|nr:hypothetical protein predicted by Glimmer/Critica [Acetobacter ghanensis]
MAATTFARNWQSECSTMAPHAKTRPATPYATA